MQTNTSCQVNTYLSVRSVCTVWSYTFAKSLGSACYEILGCSAALAWHSAVIYFSSFCWADFVKFIELATDLALDKRTWLVVDAEGKTEEQRCNQGVGVEGTPSTPLLALQVRGSAAAVARIARRITVALGRFMLA